MTSSDPQLPPFLPERFDDLRDRFPAAVAQSLSYEEMEQIHTRSDPDQHRPYTFDLASGVRFVVLRIREENGQEHLRASASLFIEHQEFLDVLDEMARVGGTTREVAFLSFALTLLEKLSGRFWPPPCVRILQPFWCLWESTWSERSFDPEAN